MLKNKKILILGIIVVALIFFVTIVLLIDSFSSGVSKDEWQNTPELALKREVQYGAEYIDSAKTEDVLSVALMLDKLEFEDKNALYAIFLSKADIFTVAKLTKDAATGKWKYHSTLFYEKDLGNSTYIYNAQNPDCTLTKDHFKDAENGYILGLKFRDNTTVRVNDMPAKMKSYGFNVNDISYSIDLWYVSEDIPEEGLSIQYKTH